VTEPLTPRASSLLERFFQAVNDVEKWLCNASIVRDCFRLRELRDETVRCCRRGRSAARSASSALAARLDVDATVVESVAELLLDAEQAAQIVVHESAFKARRRKYSAHVSTMTNPSKIERTRSSGARVWE
jgi:hypothetical protein